MQKRIEEIIQKVANKHGLPKEVVGQIYKSTFSSVRQGLLKLKNVRIINIGLFIARLYILQKDHSLTRKFKQDERYREISNRLYGKKD